MTRKLKNLAPLLLVLAAIGAGVLIMRPVVTGATRTARESAHAARTAAIGAAATAQLTLQALRELLEAVQKLYVALAPGSPEAQRILADEQRQKDAKEARLRAPEYRRWCAQPHTIKSADDGTGTGTITFHIEPYASFDPPLPSTTRAEAQHALEQLEAQCPR